MALILKLIFLSQIKEIDPILAGSDMRTYHNYAIQILNGTLLGILTCLFVYLIGKRVFGQKVGLISLLFSTIYGIFLTYEGTLLIETLSCFLITLSLFLLLNPSFRRLSLAGISLGLASLTRANILLFIPFIFLWLMIEGVKSKREELAKYGYYPLYTFPHKLYLVFLLKDLILKI